MVGNITDALYTLDTTAGTATRYQVSGSDIAYFDPIYPPNLNVPECNTSITLQTGCVTSPRGLTSYRGDLYMSDLVLATGYLSKIHLMGSNDGRAERVAYATSPGNCSADANNKENCWLYQAYGIESAPGAPPDYFDVSSTGVITYSGPAITQAGQSFTFRVLATDGKGGEGAANITVTTKAPTPTPTPKAPTPTPTPTATLTVRPDISRIAPALRSVTVSPGDRVRLSMDVYGLQDILDNDLAKDVTFEWSANPSDGSFAEGDPSVDSDTYADEREVIFTAPTSAGRYVVKAALDRSECNDGDGLDDGCVAEIELKVRRPSQPAEPTPTPANPSGAIPPILTDGEGNQYEVFTPVEGGTFDGDTFGFTAPSSAVSNGEYIGVRIYKAGAASNLGMTNQRYTLSGNLYNIAVVDAEGKPVASYLLNTPAEVCLPLPPELSSNISNLAIVATNSYNSLTVLASAVRLTASGAEICGNISQLPASVAVGKHGAPAAIPTPTPEPTPQTPETGAPSPSALAILWLIILGTAITTTSIFLLTGRKAAT